MPSVTSVSPVAISELSEAIAHALRQDPPPNPALAVVSRRIAPPGPDLP